MAPTANDNYASARVVNISTYTTTQPTAALATLDNTIESGEPASGTSPVQYKSLWYKLLPTIRMNIVCQSNPGSAGRQVWTHVYQDSGGTGAAPAGFANLQEIATSPGDDQPSTAFTAKAGWTYMVRMVQHDSRNTTITAKFVSSAPSTLVAAVPFLITLEQEAPRSTAPMVRAEPVEVTVDLLTKSVVQQVKAVPSVITVEAQPVLFSVMSVKAVPFLITLDMQAPHATVPERLAAPPVVITLDPAAPDLTTPGVVQLDAIPVDITLSPRAPKLSSIRRSLGQPLANAVVPAKRPQFSVGIRPIIGTFDGVKVEIQYGTNLNTSPVSMIQTVPNATVAIQAFTATSDMAAGTYKWRARLVVDGTAHGWTETRTFQLDPTFGNSTAPVTWTITGTAPKPHVWYVNPASGTTGSMVTVYGQGLPMENPVVTLASVTMPVVETVHHGVKPAATTADRTPLDTEHDTIQVLVPDVPAPGGSLQVTGDYA